MKIIYSIYYFFIFKLIVRRKLKNILSEFMLVNSKLTSSYIKGNIEIRNYSTRFIRNEALIKEYLNKAFPYFKIDRVKYTLDKVILSSIRLPLKFEPSKKENLVKNSVPLCIAEKGIIRWIPSQENSISFMMPAGTGKTTSLFILLKRVKDFHLGEGQLFQNIVIFDPKRQNDYDQLKSDTVKIITNQAEAVAELQAIEKLIDSSKTNPRILIVAEEYLQFSRVVGDNKNLSKEFVRVLQKVNEFMRSKGVALIVTSQNYQREEHYLPLDGFIKIVSSPSSAYCQQNSIDSSYANRNDLIFGRYLVTIRGVTSLCRMN